MTHYVEQEDFAAYISQGVELAKVDAFAATIAKAFIYQGNLH